MNVKINIIISLLISSIILIPIGTSNDTVRTLDKSIITDNSSENSSWIIIPTQLIDCNFNFTVIVYEENFELCTVVNNEKTYKFFGQCIDYFIASGENISIDYWTIDVNGHFKPKNTSYVYCDAKFDSTPPNINVIDPKNALYFNDKHIIDTSQAICFGKITIEVDAFDSLSGIHIVTFEFSDKDTGYDLIPPYNYTYNRIYFGMISVKITAYNGAGLTSSRTVSFFKLL